MNAIYEIPSLEDVGQCFISTHTMLRQRKPRTLFLDVGGWLGSEGDGVTPMSIEVLLRMSAQTVSSLFEILTDWLRAVAHAAGIVRIVALITGYAYATSHLRRFRLPWFLMDWSSLNYSLRGYWTMRWMPPEAAPLLVVHWLE